MRNKYLSILKLDSGASKSQIKTAYRKLSKIHHPDISKDPGAKENFIRINEAYDFLMKAGPQIRSKGRKSYKTYDYNPEEERFKEYRRKARARAKYKAEQAQMAQMLIIVKMLNAFKYIALAAIVFNFFILIDYLAPRNFTTEQIQSINPVYKMGKSSAKYRAFDELEFEKHSMLVATKWSKFFTFGESAEIESTPIFGFVTKALVLNGDQKKVIPPIKNPYILDLILLPVILILLISYFGLAEHPEIKLYLAVSTTFLFFMQIGNILF